mmetsp:Transcript_76026/g.211263  ORF Transcript_76026/g.211263 Transcript_76026/m.211263 type:complete len:404 (+) Transcript_76026:68-1279(+)
MQLRKQSALATVQGPRGNAHKKRRCDLRRQLGVGAVANAPPIAPFATRMSSSPFATSPAAAARSPAAFASASRALSSKSCTMLSNSSALAFAAVAAAAAARSVNFVAAAVAFARSSAAWRSSATATLKCSTSAAKACAISAVARAPTAAIAPCRALAPSAASVACAPPSKLALSTTSGADDANDGDCLASWLEERDASADGEAVYAGGGLLRVEKAGGEGACAESCIAGWLATLRDGSVACAMPDPPNWLLALTEAGVDDDVGDVSLAGWLKALRDGSTGAASTCEPSCCPPSTTSTADNSPPSRKPSPFASKPENSCDTASAVIPCVIAKAAISAGLTRPSWSVSSASSNRDVEGVAGTLAALSRSRALLNCLDCTTEFSARSAGLEWSAAVTEPCAVSTPL